MKGRKRYLPTEVKFNSKMKNMKIKIQRYVQPSVE